MTISGIGTRSALGVQSLVDMRNQLDDLQRQLGTGQKSDTYAGVGLDRGLAVGLRTRLSALGGYDDAITNVGVRINLAQSALGRIADIGHDVKGAALQTPNIDSSGTTIAQITACADLGEVLGLLNTQAGDRYLFSGSAGDKPSVESFDHIMNGDGARAGFKQVIAERKQADLGDQRPRPAGHLGADRDLGLARRGRGRLAVRLQARRRQLDAQQRDRDPDRRRAAGDLGRFHGAAQRRRDHPVPLHAARRHEREHHADRHHLGNARAGPVHHRRDAGGHRRQYAGDADGVARQARGDLADRGVGGGGGQ